MKKGNIVTIYQDPWSRQRVEGQAELIEPINWNGGEVLEYWKVKFLGGENEDPIVHRLIKKEGRIKP